VCVCVCACVCVCVRARAYVMCVKCFMYFGLKILFSKLIIH